MHSMSARVLWIGNRRLELGLRAQTGAVEGLHLRAVGRGLNFVLDRDALTEPEPAGADQLGQVRGLLRDRPGEWRRFDGAAVNCQVPLATGHLIVVRRRWPEHGLECTMSWDSGGPAGDRLVWSVRLRNLLARPLEIGQLILPLAFNNWYHGHGMDDAGMARLYAETVYVHRHLGGSASYVHLARLTGQGPDLLLLPGRGTVWRFSHYARWTLDRYTSLVQWEGIPLLYLVAAEIEGARSEPPGATRDCSVVRMPPRAAVAWQMQLRGLDDPRALASALAEEGMLPIQIEPGPVCPVDLELRVAAPGAVAVERASGLAVTDHGPVEPCAYGSISKPRWRVAATAPGESVLRVRGPGSITNDAIVRWIAPLEELIRRRSRHVLSRQLYDAPGSEDSGGIFIRNNRSGTLYRAHSDYWGPGCYEGGICDGLFAAEKNCLWPDAEEVARLEAYAAGFVGRRLQNAANDDVAWYFAVAAGGGLKTGRCFNYAHVANLYHALYRIGAAYGLTAEAPRAYLSLAARTLLRMLEVSWRYQMHSVGVLGLSNAWAILDDLEREDLGQLERPLSEGMTARARQLFRLSYPYASECEYDTTGYEEVYFLARRFGQDELAARTLAAVAAARGTAPVWWWFSSDKRWWDALEDDPLRLVGDRGENCLHYTTPANAHVLLDHAAEEVFLPDPRAIWLGYGGLLAPWALVAEDGSAAMCYCPDPASAHCGLNAFSGDIGLNLWYSLRGLKSYVYHPRRSDELFHFGCRVEQAPDGTGYVVEPRDGVRREIVFTAPPMRVSSRLLPIAQAWVAKTQDRFSVRVSNPFGWAQSGSVQIEGIWGRRAEVRVDGAMRQLLSPLASSRVAVECGPLGPGRSATIELTAGR